MYANKSLILILIFVSTICFAHGHHKMAPLRPAFNKAKVTDADVNCSVNISTLNFSEYHNFDSKDEKTQLPIYINCSGVSGMSVQYSVALNQGMSGNFLERTLRNSKNPNQTLIYNLFLDPALKIVWGDGNAGTSTLNGTCMVNTTCTQTVYAYIPANQKAANVGEYQDDVAATLTY
jgi:spore coat protein U-like protein